MVMKFVRLCEKRGECWSWQQPSVSRAESRHRLCCRDVPTEKMRIEMKRKKRTMSVRKRESGVQLEAHWELTDWVTSFSQRIKQTESAVIACVEAEQGERSTRLMSHRVRMLQSLWWSLERAATREISSSRPSVHQRYCWKCNPIDQHHHRLLLLLCLPSCYPFPRYRRRRLVRLCQVIVCFAPSVEVGPVFWLENIDLQAQKPTFLLRPGNRRVIAACLPFGGSTDRLYQTSSH